MIDRYIAIKCQACEACFEVLFTARGYNEDDVNFCVHCGSIIVPEDMEEEDMEEEIEEDLET